MAVTAIEWTDKTWNPVTGCTKVSPGCAHCYAEGVAARFWEKQYQPVINMQLASDEGNPECPKCDPGCMSNAEDCHDACEWPTRPRQFEDVQTHADRLDQPLSWKKPARIFVNSMSDLFHEDVPDAFIDQVFAVMALAPQHTFQVLTKRAERMRDYLSGNDVRDRVSVVAADRIKDPDPEMVVRFWPLLNVWLGVSVENQKFADDRIPQLLKTPAARRFISAEPLLESVEMFAFLPGAKRDECLRILGNGTQPDPALDWVIVGGESGPSARSFELAWARSIVAECKAAGVPIFMKQLGKWPLSHQNENEHGGKYWVELVDDHQRLTGEYGCEGRGAKGDMAEWPEDLRVREFPR